MSKSLLRTDKEIAEIYKRHSKTVYRVCFAYMKNPADTEDAVQDTFFQLIKSGPAFESEEHEKAWLIRTATNICKNVLRHWWRRTFLQMFVALVAQTREHRGFLQSPQLRKYRNR